MSASCSIAWAYSGFQVPWNIWVSLLGLLAKIKCSILGSWPKARIVFLSAEFSYWKYFFSDFGCVLGASLIATAPVSYLSTLVVSMAVRVFASRDLIT